MLLDSLKYCPRHSLTHVYDLPLNYIGSHKYYYCDGHLSNPDHPNVKIPCMLKSIRTGILQAVHVPNNKSPGETALYWQSRKILILGDALIGKPPGDVSLLPREKYDDITLAQKGISVLVDLDFDALLLSDGQPIPKDGKIAVDNFIEGN